MLFIRYHFLSQPCMSWGKFPAGSDDIGSGTFVFVLPCLRKRECPFKIGMETQGCSLLSAAPKGGTRLTSQEVALHNRELSSEVIVAQEGGFCLAIPNQGEPPPSPAATDTAWDPLPFSPATRALFATFSGHCHTGPHRHLGRVNPFRQNSLPQNRFVLPSSPLYCLPGKEH